MNDSTYSHPKQVSKRHNRAKVRSKLSVEKRMRERRKKRRNRLGGGGTRLG